MPKKVHSDDMLHYYDDGSVEWKEPMPFDDSEKLPLYVYAIEEDKETKFMISREQRRCK